jgi:phosphoribosyl-ATP pyrophosphohydrolase/phosphoribosyl-AMP cyclohydrolase/histidinol dehydrogenase
MMRRLLAREIAPIRRSPVAPEALVDAARILDKVREGGVEALRAIAVELGDLNSDDDLVLGPIALKGAYERLAPADRDLLSRVAERIRVFAEAQSETLCDVEIEVPGGVAGHRVTAVDVAGCYAPGGRYPLPSSMLMTAVTARVAGVSQVWAASPRPSEATLAAAHVAGVDGLLAVGGAQAIAAMAYGIGVPPCDAIVGPGNRWVTAAKQLVSGTVAIDMLAGPSELVILADGEADAGLIAADLLAQAEHDADAIPILVTTDLDLIDRVAGELAAQLADLPTADTARLALANGFFAYAESLDEGIAACDALAPEHLHLHLREAASVAARLRHYGGLFVGAASAEVLGDYGAGPNHTLPTGGTARSFAGLSVFTFLRASTYLRIDDPRDLAGDCAQLARMEGLEAHARSAERRLS